MLRLHSKGWPQFEFYLDWERVSQQGRHSSQSKEKRFFASFFQGKKKIRPLYI